MKRSLLLVLSLVSFTSLCLAGFNDFDFEDNPSQPVGRAGAFLLTRYAYNHTDGHGEQVCLLMGHDKNFNSYAPPSGHTERAKDTEIRNSKIYYSSFKALQREVLEETGGLIHLSDQDLQTAPMLYSSKFKNLLAVVYDENISCDALNKSVQVSLNDPNKDNSWKEMDSYSALPLDNVLCAAQIMKDHFDAGGNIDNLPNAILSPRKSALGNTPLVYVKDRTGKSLELCAYYLGTIADALPKFRTIIEKIVPLTVQSGEELHRIIRNGQAQRIKRVVVPYLPKGNEPFFSFYNYSNDIAQCTNLKTLIINNIFRLYAANVNVLPNIDAKKNTTIINEIARICPSNLTELEIKRCPNTPTCMSDENLNTFARRAPGITHLAIDAQCLTSNNKITDEAFVNFHNLKSLILTDGPSLGTALPASIKLERRSFHAIERDLRNSLSTVFYYHLNRGVTQLQEVDMVCLLKHAIDLVYFEECILPDTTPIIRSWEIVNGKKW
ncbi:MAG: hypothetical protein H0X26_02360 [Alphaproteobacteria bacterium]|nr:hypothetical protein [Alphaproteobacteria bacterium]